MHVCDRYGDIAGDVHTLLFQNGDQFAPIREDRLDPVLLDPSDEGLSISSSIESRDVERRNLELNGKARVFDSVLI